MVLTTLDESWIGALVHLEWFHCHLDLVELPFVDLSLADHLERLPNEIFAKVTFMYKVSINHNPLIREYKQIWIVRNRQEKSPLSLVVRNLLIADLCPQKSFVHDIREVC